MSDQLQFGTMNWRQVVKRNQRRTYMVIATFILLFLCLGFLIDFVWRYSEFSQAYQVHYGQALPASLIFKALLTGQLIPYATIISSAVAVIWILITFAMYDKIMLSGTQYKEISAQSSDPLEQRIYNVVEEMKIAAGMRYMPKVFMIEANYMNAFASGYSEKSAMVAITRPLAQSLNRDELQAVMAHELTHIRNQDIKLNLFVMVLSSMLLIMLNWMFYSMLFSGGNRSNNNRNGNNVMAIIFMVVMLLRFILPFLTTVMMLFLSRTREYMADAGAVELMRTNEPMASALMKISQANRTPEAQQAYKQTANENLRRASYIDDPLTAGISGQSQGDFFSTHPSLPNRLKSMGIRSRS